MFRDAAGNSASRRRRRVIFCVRGEQKRALCPDRQIGGRSEVLPTGVTGEADEQAAELQREPGLAELGPAGEDGKTGQTLLKTVLAPAFAIRELRVEGWFSTNILGNNDGLVLNDPASNKTKVLSKQSVLDDILGYEVEDHQVHIHYYRPRGDAKEAWDNIDLVGFLGERMQLKLDFLCKDSILAAPLVLDLVRLLDLAHRRGDRGIQKQLSLFFKSPYHQESERPVHDLFKQHDLLQNWAAGAQQG